MALARRAVNAVVGMLLGYAVWLASGTMILATVPVEHWVFAGGILLAGLTALAWVAARRCTNVSTATMVRWSPLLPGLVSVYLLLSLLI